MIAIPRIMESADRLECCTGCGHQFAAGETIHYFQKARVCKKCKYDMELGEALLEAAKWRECYRRETARLRFELDLAKTQRSSLLDASELSQDEYDWNCGRKHPTTVAVVALLFGFTLVVGLIVISIMLGS